jgi:hypothetical protein
MTANFDPILLHCAYKFLNKYKACAPENSLFFRPILDDSKFLNANKRENWEMPVSCRTSLSIALRNQKPKQYMLRTGKLTFFWPDPRWQQIFECEQAGKLGNAVSCRTSLSIALRNKNNDIIHSCAPENSLFRWPILHDSKFWDPKSLSGGWEYRVPLEYTCLLHCAHKPN